MNKNIGRLRVRRKKRRIENYDFTASTLDGLRVEHDGQSVASVAVGVSRFDHETVVDDNNYFLNRLVVTPLPKVIRYKCKNIRGTRFSRSNRKGVPVM